MTKRLIAILGMTGILLTACTQKSLSNPETFTTGTDMPYIIPASLNKGDKIALITPASSIDSMVVVRAAQKISSLGYEPVTFPHAFGRRYGSYAANDSQRAADLMAAFSDPSIKAIMCTRGGYGTARLLPMIDLNVIRQNPKWLIGYSDISDLHAVMKKAKIASIHGPMCAHIDKNSLDEKSTSYLFEMLRKGLPMSYSIKPNSYNIPGKAQGRLVGGNLLTINALAETPYDVLNNGENEDQILFIEDVSEEIYAIERVFHRLHQSGALGKFKGLIIGEFTEYKPSRDFKSMEQMINYWLKTWGYNMPVMYGFPGGHGMPNYPLPMGATAKLNITSQQAEVSFE